MGSLDTIGGGTAGGGSTDPVTPPSAQSQSVAQGGSLSAVTFGAFTDSGGRISSYSATKTNVSGSGTISGTGLGPYTFSGTADGEVITVELDALDSGGNVLATAVFTGTIAGGAQWVDKVDLDFTDVTTVSALSVGSHTLTFESSADTIDVDFSVYSGGNGTVTPTNGSGLVYDGGTDTSSTNTLSLDLDPLLSSYTVEDVRSTPYAVHIVITGLTYPSAGNSSIYVGLNQGNNVSHNSGIARMLFAEDANDATNERIRVRRNTSASAIQATTAIKTSRVVTLILTGGEIVEVMDTSGTTPPTPASGASGTLMVGSDSVGLVQANPDYQNNGLRAFVASGDTADLTVTRLLIQRLQ